VLIAQLSDTHVMTGDDSMSGFVDTAARVTEAVDALLALPTPPDVVLLTGDLVNRGTDAEYEILRPLLSPLDDAGVPLLVVPGNHDDRDAMRRAFPDHTWLPTEGHLSFVVDDFPVRLIGLDSTVPGRDDGELDDERIEWLAHVLDREPARPTLLFVHHPPYRTGMWWMDYGGLKNAAALRELVERHPEVQRIVSGHVHRRSSTNWGPTVLTSAPSTFYTTSPGVPGVTVPQVVDLPGAIPLLHLTDDGTWVSGELDPPGPATRVALPALIGDRWDGYAARARAGAQMPQHLHR
jgi:3',5'-cyclic-AMP phosphodiesterase